MAEYSKLFVVLFGVGVVFVGLICIIVLTIIMGKIMTAFGIVLTIIMGKIMTAFGASKTPTRNDTMTEVKKVAEEHPQQTASGIPTDVVVAIMAALSDDPGMSSRGWNITSIKKSI